MPPSLIRSLLALRTSVSLSLPPCAFVILLGTMLSSQGCTAPPVWAGTETTGQTRSFPLSYDELKAASLKLRRLMSEQEVTALLGPPDRTEMRTMGSATNAPWQGWAWLYPYGYKTFSVIFYEGETSYNGLPTSGGWVLATWYW